LGQSDRAFGGAGQPRLVDFERCDLSAQHRIFQATLLVGSDGVRRYLSQWPADAALAPARDHRALMLKQIFADVPAAVNSTDHIGLRYPDIVEKGLAEWRPSGDQQDGLGRDAFGSHVEQDEA